jgi:hypothetical protein
MNRWRLLLGFTALAAGCDGEPTSDSSPRTPPAESPRIERSEPPGSERFELLGDLSRCEFFHKGLLIDLGGPESRWRRGYALDSADDEAPSERQGGSFARMTTKRQTYDFWLSEPIDGARITARIYGASSVRVVAQIDALRAGSLRLDGAEPKILPLVTVSEPLAAGRHTLSLRFLRPAASSDEPYAEIDWLRVARTEQPVEAQQNYAAPTLRDIVSDVALDDKPKRALVLRAPSAVRCPVRLGKNVAFHTMLGFWGNGKGRVEVRLLREGEPPISLSQRSVTGGGGATWVPLELDLRAFASQFVGLELSVLEASAGGRVAFGEPLLTRPTKHRAPSPSTRTVVLVIASGLDRRRIPPWGPIGAMPAFGELARTAAAFGDYRAPTSLPAGAVASMLTALPPTAHGVTDQAARLPDTVRTIAEIVKEAGGRTAMVTGVPTTFPAFGFGTGWDEYEVVSPIKDVPATEPYAWAARWLERELDGDRSVRRFVVVHARGAHPPWDVSKREARRLLPQEYDGFIDPRRGGIVLGKVRARSLRAQRRIADGDWLRVRSLEDAAMVKEAAGFAHILRVLKQRQALSSSLVIFAGDVAAGERPDIPYEPAGELSEGRLTLPLLVKFPDGQFAGQEIAAPTTAMDIGLTILQTLDLELPDTVAGVNLHTLAVGREPVAGRALVAALGKHFATRYGSWRLWGELGKVPRLCQLDIDPACVTDRFATAPLAGPATWRQTVEALRQSQDIARRLGRKTGERPPAQIDPDTAAALTVWGDIQ